jgi:hypothetical protein
MPLGPGKYDVECGDIRERTKAQTVIVIVIGGSKGTGFSMQSTDPMHIGKTPMVLRTVAAEIESSVPKS